MVYREGVCNCFSENSPALQGWVNGFKLFKVPSGTKERFRMANISFVPAGLELVCSRVYPALKRWAIFKASPAAARLCLPVALWRKGSFVVDARRSRTNRPYHQYSELNLTQVDCNLFAARLARFGAVAS